MSENIDRYADILLLSPPRSPLHPPMPAAERAAQIAPFAALSGFGSQICEEARLTDCRPPVSEEDARQIDCCLRLLGSSALPRTVRLSYFLPDGSKPGGAVLDHTGDLRRVDTVARELIFTDKTVIPLDDILWLAII